MIRLFLKLYGVLIATLVLSFVVQMQLMDHVWHEMSSAFDYRVRFVPMFHLLDEAVSAAPPAERASRFAALARGFGVPARLVPAEAVPERAKFKPEQASAFAEGRIVAVDREGGYTVLRRLGSGELAAAVDFPGPDSARLKVLTYALNWAVEFSVVAVLVFFWVRPFWRDLGELRKAADAVGGGRFEAQPRVGRRSALRPLGEAFATMAQRVSALIQSHRTLTSAVSHELRTPLARLRFSHSLLREEDWGESRERLLARMERDIAEIDELTAELLDYARLERGMPAIQPEVVPTAPWLEDLLADARDDRLAVPVRVEARVAAEEIRCEPRYMARAVVNLVRNGRAHARSTVRVSVESRPGRTAIHVDDDGGGIAPADRQRLFEPFVRLDPSRARDSGGSGLGLAIVRQVARWHGGDAVITDSPLGGTRVTIAW